MPARILASMTLEYHLRNLSFDKVALIADGILIRNSPQWKKKGIEERLMSKALPEENIYEVLLHYKYDGKTHIDHAFFIGVDESEIISKIHMFKIMSQ